MYDYITIILIWFNLMGYYINLIYNMGYYINKGTKLQV